jgi:DNA helicase-2/ATP-dependent DNA helicase PcrA
MNETIIQSLCVWESRTVNGFTTSTAEPTPEFWSAWRKNKDAMRALGVKPRPMNGGGWSVQWDRPAPKAPVAPPQVPVQVSPQVAAHGMTQPLFAQLVAQERAHVSKLSFVEEPLDTVPTPVAAAPVKTDRVWSAEQEAIFDWFKSTPGALVVRARAGTGKTTTIKTAFTHAPEERMLYAVFNKKNQLEAQRAITDARVEIKTLHSVGLMFIKQVWENCKPLNTLDNERVTAVVGAQSPREVQTQVTRLVRFAKNVFVGVPELSAMMELAMDRDIECPAFEDELNGGYTRQVLSSLAIRTLILSLERDAENRISFDDMVWLPVAKGWVRAWYDLVCVDEAQDMNLPQLIMAKGACKPGGRVCVVGDDRQAIYGFRGAASDGMTMMREALGATELSLTTTYRCPKSVVKLAAVLVPDYKAAATAPEGLVEDMDINNIVSRVLVGDAILSRANAPLMPLCLRLLRKGIPSRIEGRDIGKTLLDIVEKFNAQSVPQFITKVEKWRDRQISRVKDSKRFEEKAAQINDQADTLVAIAEGASSVREITNRLSALFQDTEEDSKPAVVLSTTHKAKGLEWPRVYLLRDTYMSKRPRTGPPQSEAAKAAQAREEANIYYVALTRAKQHLVLAEGRLTDLAR